MRINVSYKIKPHFTIPQFHNLFPASIGTIALIDSVVISIMNPVLDVNLTKADILVLSDLFHDINVEPKINDTKIASTLPTQNNGKAVSNGNVKENGTTVNGKLNGHVNQESKLSVEEQLNSLTDINSESFEPTVFTNFDKLPSSPLLELYVHYAQKVVRRPTDVVFLTHILIYLTTLLPSAFFLFRHFTYPHAIAHYILTTYYSGAYTLMLHNHIHNNGLFKAEFAIWDRLFPYILSPWMGHTINSYYYHHVKHHHVEGNGPDDLSSTIRYQRDSVASFAHYVLRFLLLIWIDLPLYFIRKGKRTLALKSFTTEMSCYAAIAALYMWKPQAAWWTLCVPLIQMRVGMMVGNWGQHALVDEEDPASDFRSSITLIDVPVSIALSDAYHP